MKNSETLLIEEIINELKDLNSSLVSVLLKLHFFSKLIDFSYLYDYTEKEIEGYGKSDLLPNYRLIEGDLKIDAYENSQNRFGLPLSRELLGSPYNKILRYVGIREGIKIIESRISLEKSLETKNEYLQIELAPFMLQHLTTTFNKIYRKETPIEIKRAYTEFSRYKLHKILSELRGRLINFSLEVVKIFGYKIESDSFEKNRNENLKIIQEIIDDKIIYYNDFKI